MYLKNNICNFEPLYDFNPNEKYDIISTVLFKMKNSYRDLNFYVDQFKNTYKILKTNFPKYKIRMFIDDNIFNDKNLMNKLNKYDDLQLVRFKCNSYLIDNYHIGLFSTMIRFFPLFDFDNNDTNFVIISDIDYNKKFIKQLVQILYHIDNITLNKLSLVKYNMDYTSSNSYMHEYSESHHGYIIAQSIIGINKINHEVIINFLNEVLNNKIDTHTKYTWYKIIDYSKLPDIKYYKQINYNNDHKSFTYGIDEYFLSTTLPEYLSKNNIPYASYESFSLIGLLTNYMNNGRYTIECKNKSITLKYFKKLVSYLLSKVNVKYNDSKSIKENYLTLYHHLIGRGINENLLYYLYKFSLKHEHDKKYTFLFSNGYYKLIHGKLFGYYNYASIVFYNYNKKSISLINNKFDKDKLENLIVEH